MQDLQTETQRTRNQALDQSFFDKTSMGLTRMEALANGGRVDDVALADAALEVLGRDLHSDLRQ